MPFTIVTQGTFVQPTPAVNQIIPLPSSADYFVTTNLTQMALQPATGVVVRGEWYGGGLTAVNDGIRWKKNGTTPFGLQIDTFANNVAPNTTSNGFTYVTSFPAPQAALTGTTITAANPAVATVTNTYSNGDTVVIYNAVGMEQISGMTFTISSVSGSGFTLLGLNALGFAAPATAFTVRRVNQFTPVEPSFLYVTAVTNAVNAQVTVSQANSVSLGQKLEFTVPASFGMVQLNNFYQRQNLPIVVTSIVDAYNFKINIDTTNYTAFAFPASTLSPTAQLFATVAPAGQSTQFNPITGVQTGYNFLQIPFHTGVFIPYMYLPAGAQSPGGAAGDTIVWQAYKMETGTINAPVPS
jgi:hypothetical protein